MLRIVLLGFGVIIPSVAIAGVDQWAPETWIGYLTKLGLTGALATFAVAEAFALLWTARKLLARDSRNDERLEENTKALQAVADSNARVATVIDKCHDRAGHNA